MKRYLLLLFSLFSLNAYSTNIDSLKAILKNTKLPDTIKYYTSKILFNFYLEEKNINEADIYLKICTQIAEKIKSDLLLGNKNSLQGSLFIEVGEYSKAIESNLQALAYYKKAKSPSNEATILNDIGRSYFYLQKPDEALHYFTQSVEKETDQSKKNNCLLNIGVIYAIKKDFAKAESYFMKLKEIYEDSNDIKSIAYVLNNLGLLFSEQKKYDKAKEYLEKAYKIKMQIGSKDEIINANYTMADYYLNVKNFDKTKQYIDRESKYLDTNIKNSALYEYYDLLVKYYNATNNHKNAYEYLLKKTILKEKLYDEEKLSEIKNNEIKQDFQNKILADSITNANKEKIQAIQISEQAAKIKQAQTIRYTLIGGMLFALITGFFMFKKYRETNMQNKIIESQNLLLAKKNKETEDSLLYASRLQNGILPVEKELKKELQDIFIYYAPKDIVSGDFYWSYKKDQYLYLAVGDCTGHGVPGAMMSFLSFNNLERCVKELKLEKPSEILENLSDLIEQSFGKNDRSIRDGLDIAILKIDTISKKSEFAGANNNIYHVSEGSISKIAATRRAVGYSEIKQAFQNTALELKSNDLVYLLTDGYADQIGGPNGKKFLSKKLAELLLSMKDESLPTQKTILQNAFREWSNREEQVDDVTVLGIKI
jgi:serine phosphatase RsbU (regulator of sigma subunit)/Tfp pilus assembly protein PilF